MGVAGIFEDYPDGSATALRDADRQAFGLDPAASSAAFGSDRIS